jgi:hypothetical protein
VANRLPRAANLISISGLTQEKNRLIAHCVTNHSQRAANLFFTKEFTQAKNHTVAQCVANPLHKKVIWVFTVEKFMLKKAFFVKMTKRFMC